MKHRNILLLVVVMLLVAPAASAAWTQKWHTDLASPDYDWWSDYYPSPSDRIKYTTQIMPVCGDAIHNGNGPSGKPILEVFVASGPVHGQGVCPICGYSGGGTIPHIAGCITCLNGATGDVIWRHVDNRIFVQSKMELADVDDDGDLELFVNCYHGYMLLDAKDGHEIWGDTRSVRCGDKYAVIVRDNRETIDGIANLGYGEVFIYQSYASSAIRKLDKNGNVVAEGIYSGGPCFGGCSAADMNNDGVPEIVEHTYTPGSRFCYDLDLNLIWQDSSSGGGGSVPVLYDVNSDGWLDVVVTCSEGPSWQIGVLDGKKSWENRVGTYMSGKSLTNPAMLDGHNAPTVALLADGRLLAFTTHSDHSHSGAWNLITWEEEPEFRGLVTQNWYVVLANVYGDSKLELLSGFSGNKCYDQNGALVSSTTGGGSTPQLVADIDGDDLNEVVTWGSNQFSVANTPWGNPYTVWSNAWFVCWDTNAEALNPYQAVYSQGYSSRRLGTEVPVYAPLWINELVPTSVTCWACIEGAAYSYEFPAGTLCGAGAAAAFPYSSQPNCAQPPTVCWKCVAGQLTSLEVPYGEEIPDGWSTEKPTTCILSSVPGFEVLLLVFAMLVVVLYNRRTRSR